MKGNEALLNSYNKQKELFELSRNKRIRNRNSQIQQIQKKIQILQTLQRNLLLQNQEEKEFESFDSFRRKAEEQFLKQKKPEETV